MYILDIGWVMLPLQMVYINGRRSGSVELVITGKLSKYSCAYFCTKNIYARETGHPKLVKCVRKLVSNMSLIDARLFSDLMCQQNHWFATVLFEPKLGTYWKVKTTFRHCKRQYH